MITGLIILLIGFLVSRAYEQPLVPSCDICETGIRGFDLYRDVLKKLIPVIIFNFSL
ncbi:hypothetical protein MUY27_18910 [Mucilaginibacter sp. RS28]|uniref:Uncharacterized protein n=1 Tax=Mucilaginibacter straminoryzae TaxID=2932774 RepID=A0A9X1X622_9SPHI|nr:hypothetical protein [Mucilaginibacter straminoryzae]MCJ8211797.1 hypothetical protein [Mucilaginibacter straminoryzae]